MGKYLFISPIKRPLALAYLGNARGTSTENYLGGNNRLPPCVVLLPPFFADEGQLSRLIFGMKIIVALFEEAASSRISLQGLQFLENGGHDVLVSRARYLPPIQYALSAAYENLQKVTTFAHPPPLGLWMPHIRILKGVDLRSTFAHSLPANFGAIVDEPIAPPMLMVREEGGWGPDKRWFE